MSKNIAQYNFTLRSWDKIFDLHSCQDLSEQAGLDKRLYGHGPGTGNNLSQFDLMKVRSETQFRLTTSPVNTFLYLWGRIYPLWIPLITPMGTYQWSNARVLKKLFINSVGLFGTTSTEPIENNFKNAISCLCWGKILAHGFKSVPESTCYQEGFQLYMIRDLRDLRVT